MVHKAHDPTLTASTSGDPYRYEYAYGLFGGKPSATACAPVHTSWSDRRYLDLPLFELPQFRAVDPAALDLWLAVNDLSALIFSNGG